jgi:hypothetical protein
MLDVQLPACMVVLIAHMHRGHTKLAGLEELDYILGGESLDALPVNIRGSINSGHTFLSLTEDFSWHPI